MTTEGIVISWFFKIFSNIYMIYLKLSLIFNFQYDYHYETLYASLSIQECLLELQ